MQVTYQSDVAVAALAFWARMLELKATALAQHQEEAASASRFPHDDDTAQPLNLADRVLQTFARLVRVYIYLQLTPSITAEVGS